MNRREAIRTVVGGVALSFTPWLRAQQKKEFELLGYIRTNWSQDPFSFGSYSYIAKGSRRRDIRALEKPVGDSLFFAGEATHPHRNSTVHAAHESGLRVAESILQGRAKRIAVIGAGMSGLTAAKSLSENGIEVEVFEGRDRIGGRIWTEDRLGTPLDLGASWIHGTKRNPLTKLAQAQNQTLVETDDEYIIRRRDGRRINDSEAPPWLEDVVSVQHSAGASIEKINRLAYLASSDYGGPEVVFPEGYAPILDAFKGEYKINLNTNVEAIRYADEKATVATSQSGDQSFDAVLVTVPLGVLKEGVINFDPELPKDKTRAINRLGMGTLDKLYLQFKEPFWDLDATWIATPENDLPPGQFNQWLNLYRYFNHPIIMAFNGGQPALDLAELSDEELVEKALHTITLPYS